VLMNEFAEYSNKQQKPAVQMTSPSSPTLFKVPSPKLERKVGQEEESLTLHS
jgi:hypothetical protein